MQTPHISSISRVVPEKHRLAPNERIFSLSYCSKSSTAILCRAFFHVRVVPSASTYSYSCPSLGFEAISDLQGEALTWNFSLPLPLLRRKISESPICSSLALSTSAWTKCKCKTGRDESEKDNQTTIHLEKRYQAWHTSWIRFVAGMCVCKCIPKITLCVAGIWTNVTKVVCVDHSFYWVLILD